ncbi:hypothetical protein [Natronorubrum texcoconense]|uniref:Uncharacterized protein n=1 Tax=Natronorubrum texcoconense TaxID=1095776 RepID=A0A1G8UM37_9EURY|nr:hypothetical protein [Natronorubrum texcoconense]SDJ54060.1 hypothetical protein SAMN04515672_0919 [Natronorubrum texcoconense]
MWLALVSTELLTVIAMLALLVGVPLFVVGVIAVFSAYVRFDAEQYLEEVDASEGEQVGGDDERR